MAGGIGARRGGYVTVQAITFDFWDTLAVDDSDEPLVELRRLYESLS